MTRIAFLGTPDAAVPSLEALHEKYGVALVVTQPDRPRGRSRSPVAPPVKQYANEAGLRVEQPETGAQLRDTLTRSAPLDLAVVVAYGRILRPDVLDIPDHGMLNVHFSLLPRWRGAAPVNRALIAGDPMSGVTIIQLDEGLDTGPVLNAQAVDILPREDAGTLTGRLSRLGASLLTRSIDHFLGGDLIPQPQTEEGATYAHKLTAADRPIDPTSQVADVVALVRGLSPTPAATLVIDGETHKILEVEPSSPQLSPGVWEARDGEMHFGLADGSLRVVNLHPPGRKEMSGADWLRGRPAERGNTGSADAGPNS